MSGAAAAKTGERDPPTDGARRCGMGTGKRHRSWHQLVDYQPARALKARAFLARAVCLLAEIGMGL